MYKLSTNILDLDQIFKNHTKIVVNVQKSNTSFLE